MGLLDDYSGLGMSPRPRWEHQQVLGNLFLFLRNHLDDGFLVMTEASIEEEDLNGPAPDLVVYDPEKEAVVMIIEVTTTKERKEIIKKVKDLLKSYPSVEEAFVYDYEKDSFIDIENYEYSSSAGFCELIGLDLSLAFDH